jgi:hypothetical protein
LPGSAQEAFRHSRLRLSPHFSIEKQAPVGRLDHPPPLLSPRPGQEAIHLEDTLLGQDQTDGPTELRGQDGKRLALAVLAREPLHVLLPGGVVAQEQGRRLGEGPLQMDVADLGASGAELLAR